MRVGVELLESFPQTHEFAQVVREDHERFDGLGYPDGKAAGDICIEARIIAVADAWTAMLADRPYREPARAVTPVPSSRRAPAHSSTPPS